MRPANCRKRKYQTNSGWRPADASSNHTGVDLMLKTITFAAFGVLLASSGAALAGGKSSCAPGQNKAALVAFYGAGGLQQTGSPTPGGVVDTLGGAISGGFYGNTSNSGIDSDAPANGHGVTPSISPGPQTVGGGGPGTGTSIGDAIQACGAALP
jgi:hypothetical protein